MRAAARGPRRRHRTFRRRDSARRRHHDRLRPHEPHPRNRSRKRARRRRSPASSISISPAPSRPTAISTRPILPASAPAPSAATWPKMPAGRTRWPTASPPITFSGLEFVLPDGTVIETGGKEADLPGYDLTGLLTGSEGTMALVTKVIVRLMRKPELVKTILAIYDSQRGRRTHRGRNHGARHHAGRGRNARWRDAAHGGRSHPRGLPDGCRRGPADRTGRHARSGGRAGGADPRGLRQMRRARSSAWRAPPKSASCSGRAARTRSARWAASARPTTCRMAWCRAPRSRPRCEFIGEVSRTLRPHHQQHLPRGRRQPAPDHPVRPAQARRSRKSSRRRRRDSALLHRGRRLHHRRARRRHGEERADGHRCSPKIAGNDGAPQSSSSIPTAA